MRKVYIGNFVDCKPAEYDGYDTGLIGEHIAVSHERNQLLKTLGLEYYVKDPNNGNLMIDDATFIEKLLARLKFIFTPQKKKVVGYRTDRLSDLLKPGYSLGRKYDSAKKQWVIDKSYSEEKGYTSEFYYRNRKCC